MDTTQIRKYFLSSQEELRQEDFDLTADAATFASAEEVESELVDDYVLGRLSASEHADFEKNYLVTAARRAMVAETKRLVEVAAGIAVNTDQTSDSVTFGWFFDKRLVSGVAFASVVALVVLWFVGTRPNAPIEVAKVEPSAKSETVEPPMMGAVQGSDSDKATEASGNRNPKKFTPATISLSPRNFRSSGREIVILKDDTRVPFLLKLETEPGARLFSNYAIKIETPEGVQIQSSSTIISKTKSAVTVSVVGNFEAGTYIVYLVGMNKSADGEAVGEYAFRVIDK